MTMSSTDREKLLSAWVKPSSDSEKDQQDRAERMVRDAIKGWAAFDGVDYEIYTKGSYPNNTNVRADSDVDVDVVVECHECSYYDYTSGVTGSPGVGSPYKGPWTKADWRKQVGDALIDAFGKKAVDRSGKIALNVAAVPGSRPSADVVPSFLYYRYLDSERRNFHTGSCVWDTDENKIVNWPAQQLANGKAKNIATGSRYKKFVRALKRAENVLAAQGTIDEMPSYFMECLVWNVLNTTLSSEASLEAGFRATLVELWSGFEGGDASEWDEPNQLKWLFKGKKKWTIDDGKKLVLATWNYLDY